MLGGTTEAAALAVALAGAGRDGVYSYAGAVATPRAQPLPVRIGGFGGAEGLAAWCRANRIAAIIDATHPFAARISLNACLAARMLDLPLLAVERAPWLAQPEDRWIRVPDMAAAARSLVGDRVFLAIGRNELAAFRGLDHHFLLRLVDAPQTPPLPGAEWIVARGPFQLHDDLALLRAHRITCVVSKNSGGSGAFAKIEAARALSLPVVMVDRPTMPPRQVVETVDQAMGWVARHVPSDAKRGV